MILSSFHRSEFEKCQYTQNEKKIKIYYIVKTY